MSATRMLLKWLLVAGELPSVSEGKKSIWGLSDHVVSCSAMTWAEGIRRHVGSWPRLRGLFWLWTVFFGLLTRILFWFVRVLNPKCHPTRRTSRLLPGKHPQVFWILCSRDIKNNLPLVLRQAGEKRLRYPLVERRVATGQQLCTGIVHAGTGEGHVITAGYT